MRGQQDSAETAQRRDPRPADEALNVIANLCQRLTLATGRFSLVDEDTRHVLEKLLGW